jgi:hypothetical protein
MSHIPPTPNNPEARNAATLAGLQRQLATLTQAMSKGGGTVALTYGGWKDAGAGWKGGSLSVDSSNRLFLHGLITPTTATTAGSTNATIATLPEGLWPNTNHMFVSLVNSVSVARIDVYLSGVIQYTTGPAMTAGTDYLTLEGFSFLIGS